jgi:signal transduction histidine kinase
MEGVSFMKHFTKIILLLAIFNIGSNIAIATTKDESKTIAVNYVKKSIQKLNSSSEKDAFDSIRQRPAGENPKFSVIVYDFDGVIKAWSFSPSYEGKSILAIQDLSGNKIIQNVIKSSKQNPVGWYDLSRVNPWSGQPGVIKSYYEVFNNYIVACGYYE